MTFDYTAIRSTATSILTNFGQDATVTRIGGSTFNPTTGAYSGGSTSTVSGKGVRMNYSKSEIDGEMVQRDDAKLYFSADGGTPEIDDNVLFDSENYRVMSVITISPSDTDVMYELQLRH
tara:strand:+ start:198 stop:557 length:360 start_codon:yes stop_codon:yes gene_type:complete